VVRLPRTGLGAALALVLISLCACDPAEPRVDQRTPAEHATAGSPVTASSDRWSDLANDLAMLAAGRPSLPAELEKLAALDYSRDAFKSYISELLATPEAAKVAVQVLNLEVANTRISKTLAVLQHADVDGAAVYYLRKSCSRSEAVKVKPWWNLTTTVLVCPESYQPDLFAEDALTCTGLVYSPTTTRSPC